MAKKPGKSGGQAGTPLPTVPLMGLPPAEGRGLLTRYLKKPFMELQEAPQVQQQQASQAQQQQASQAQ